MYLVSLFAFIMAAVIGLVMAVLHFRGIASGKALGIAHGLFALSGIALLAVGLWQVNAGTGWWVLAGFAAAAAGGAYLFSRQIREKAWPGAAVVAHGGLAALMIVALGIWLIPTEPTSAGERGDPDGSPNASVAPVDETYNQEADGD
ncbi:MAG: hypothetical protein AAGK21_09865 [Bacteroidota bacterium]